MRFNLTDGNSLAVFSGILGQVPKTDFDLDPPENPPGSYAEAWERLQAQCENWLGETECKRLLGYTPFVCPVPSERPLTANWWFWLAFGLTAGIVTSKLAL